MAVPCAVVSHALTGAPGWLAAQIRQLLFPGVPNRKPDAGNLEMERAFKVSASSDSSTSLTFRRCTAREWALPACML